MARLRPWLFSAAVALAVATPSRADDALPLKRVRLYETGVGYFERSGALGQKAAALPVPAAHLDDALKTLVVLSDDPNAGISGVEFPSSVSPTAARSLAGLPADDEGPLKLHALLKSLKGVSVEIRSGKTSASGRLVEIVDAEQSDLETCVKTAKAKGEEKDCVVQKQASLVLLTKKGEIQRYAVSEVNSVRPLDAAYASRMASALDALSDRSARVLKDLKVVAKSQKTVALGYVAESPVWRVSYRLVLGGARADEGVLQGWALLHNDTDEPWRAVRVELVNGRPDSFLFPLAAPRYARRELVTPDNPLSTVPQLTHATPDSMWDVDESYGAGGLGLSGVGEGGGGRGEGIGLGSIGTIGHGGGVGSVSDGASSLLSVGNLAGVQQAGGVEAGALFRYSLAKPVDLSAHSSALVPFLQGGIAARRIALFSAADQPARSAVHLTHQGNQTLPPGTVAVFADGGFAGESALQRLKPKETQVVQFGADLDVELRERSARSRDETRVLGFESGQLVEHFVRHHTVAYELENRSGSGRDAMLVLAYVNNSKVQGADEVVFDSHSGKALAVLKIGPQAKLDRTLRVEEGLSRAHDPKTLSSAWLRKMGASKLLSAAQKKLVLEAADHVRDSEVRRGALGKRKAELATAQAEVLRLREHARALGAARGTESVVKRLLAAEDRAKKLRQRIAELGSEASAKRRQATAVLAKLAR